MGVGIERHQLATRVEQQLNGLLALEGAVVGGQHERAAHRLNKPGDGEVEAGPGSGLHQTNGIAQHTLLLGIRCADLQVVGELIPVGIAEQAIQLQALAHVVWQGESLRGGNALGRAVDTTTNLQVDDLADAVAARLLRPEAQGVLAKVVSRGSQTQVELRGGAEVEQIEQGRTIAAIGQAKPQAAFGCIDQAQIDPHRLSGILQAQVEGEQAFTRLITKRLAQTERGQTSGTEPQLPLGEGAQVDPAEQGQGVADGLAQIGRVIGTEAQA